MRGPFRRIGPGSLRPDIGGAEGDPLGLEIGSRGLETEALERYCLDVELEAVGTALAAAARHKDEVACCLVEEGCLERPAVPIHEVGGQVGLQPTIEPAAADANFVVLHHFRVE